MAVIGCLGDIPFIASDSLIRTLEKVKWSGTARYANHQRHGNNALTEFVGMDTDKFSFMMSIGVDLGTDPMEESKKLWKYMRNGDALPLTLGEHAYGRYRWSIISLSIEPLSYDVYGNLAMAQATVSLQEYLRG